MGRRRGTASHVEEEPAVPTGGRRSQGLKGRALLVLACAAPLVTLVALALADGLGR